MTIDIRPDPSRPRGGYAVLAVPAAALPEATVTVTLLNPYNDRYLGGDGFQSEPAAFGPYPVVRDEAQARVTVGPEIVNQVEEYAQLRITVGSVTGTAIWPDTVVPAPGAARIGGLLRPGERVAPAAGAALAASAPASVPAAPEPEPAPAAPAVAPAPAGGARTGLWIGLGGVLLAAAVAAGLYLSGYLTPAPPPEPAPPPAPAAVPAPEPAPAPEPEPAPLPDPCGADALAALRGQPFAAVGAQVRSCGAAVSADLALSLLEDGAAAGDAEALVLFGTLYDAEAVDPVFETAIGLSLADQPAIAADYYARARDAGSAEAAARLQAACVRLGTRTDTTSRSVHDRLCAP